MILRAVLAPVESTGGQCARNSYPQLETLRTGRTSVRCSELPNQSITNRPPTVRFRSRQATRRGRRRALGNRRKSCALNRPNAHNGPLVVRVGALTNKAAHYRFHLVRTGQRALRALTSISITATCNISRDRRAAAGTGRQEVRKPAAVAHSAEKGNGRTAHKNAAHAQQNAWFAHLTRMKERRPLSLAAAMS